MRESWKKRWKHLIRLSPVGQIAPVLKALVSEAGSHQEMKMLWDFREPLHQFGVSLCHERFTKHLFFSSFSTLDFPHISQILFWIIMFSTLLFFDATLRNAPDPAIVRVRKNGSILSGLRWTACQVWSPHLLGAACYPGLISSSVPHAAPCAIESCRRSRCSLLSLIFHQSNPSGAVSSIWSGPWPVCTAAKPHSKGWHGRAVFSDKQLCSCLRLWWRSTPFFNEFYYKNIFFSPQLQSHIIPSTTLWGNYSLGAVQTKVVARLLHVIQIRNPGLGLSFRAEAPCGCAWPHTKASEKPRKQPENKGKGRSQVSFACSRVVPKTESVARRRMRHSSAANHPMCVASGQRKEGTGKRGEGRKGRWKSLLADICMQGSTRSHQHSAAARCAINQTACLQQRRAPTEGRLFIPGTLRDLSPILHFDSLRETCRVHPE